MPLEAITEQHKADILYSDIYDSFRVTVRRGHIFDDTLVALRSGFDEKKHLRVSFLGERGVDGGGPRREFFMLLMGCIGSILDGPPERRFLRHNTTAFEVCERVCFIPRMRFTWLLAKLLLCPFYTVAQVQLFCPMYH